MMKQTFRRRFGFQNLLFWLLVYLVVNPFLSGLPHPRIIFQLLLTLVLFFAVFAIYKKNNILTLSVTLMAVSITLHWLGVFGIIPFSQWIGQIPIILYLSVLIYAFFKVIFSIRKVSFQVICATLCVYLIMGLLWAQIYMLLETLAPGSFTGKLLAPENPLWIQGQGFVYFSFITITTLGYGDITPQTQGAGALCQVEAIIGQFYIAVVVARLVSMYRSEKPQQEDSDD
ncbi:Ion channel [delta proteobacterium NaphS2]|nr:Ion channel [delta proteobacterium NaphS2]